MASPNTSWSEIITTTIASRSRKLADNLSENCALLMRLQEKGNSKPFSGGRVIAQELSYDGNDTYKRYSGYETLNISPSDTMTAAEYAIKQAAVAVSVSGLEKLQNSGQEQMINLVAERVRNAERTMKNNLSNDIYSDGTADGGKQVGGLQHLVTDDGTGSPGGIDGATYTWWANAFYDFSDLTITPSATTIQAAMNSLYLSVSRNADRPDLIVADNTYFGYYWTSLQANQRFSNEKMAAAGFDNLRFMGADVLFDGGQGGDAPASHMYFLNTDYIFLRPHRDCNMVPLDPENRYAVNQDATVKLIGWAGNMTCSNRSLQGAIVA